MLTYAMRSRPGDRDYNEDTIRMQENGATQIFLLADGLGGCGHGEMASSTAVDSVAKRFLWDDPAGENFLPDAMEGAQNAVSTVKEKYPEMKKMSTTLVILRISGGFAQWIHIGDSRLYLFRKNRVVFQTLDHSVPQMLVNMGEIRPDEIRHHPDRNRLLRTIGSAWTDQPYELSEKIPLQKGEAFLLASDGFWEYIEEKDMCRTLAESKNVAGWIERMTTIVEENGRSADMDNYSAVCVWLV
ncbi:MAG: protein phosphatase 2C domain-containing protein [Lachnospiraceae bacterium]|nr:protein phosphatase 2C domain-containing protein [Lachnospiraceae bacterium]